MATRNTTLSLPLQIHEYTNHDSSVNSVQWAPHDFGLVSRQPVFR